MVKRISPLHGHVKKGRFGVKNEEGITFEEYQDLILTQNRVL